MRYWLVLAVLMAVVAVLVGCAVAIGEGATACVDLDTRSALVIDSAASAPRGEFKRADETAGVNCQGTGRL